MAGKGRNIASKIAAGLVILLAAAVLALEIPSVQTKLARALLESLSGGIDADLSVGSVSVMLPNSVVLEDVACVDRHPYTEDVYGKGYTGTDTLFYAGKVTATISPGSIFSGGPVRLGRVSVEDGGFALVTEPDEVYGSNVARIFRSGDGEDRGPWGDILRVGSVSVRNCSYRMVNFRNTGSNYRGHSINYEDMYLTADITAHDIAVKDGLVSGVVDSLSCTEKCGYTLRRLSGRCTTGLGRTEVTDLHIVDDWTDVYLNCYIMDFGDISAFSDFLNKVRITGDIAGGKVAMRTISYFGGPKIDNDIVWDTRGGLMVGTVSDFTVTGMHARDLHTGLETSVECRLYGLPDVNRLHIDADLDGCTFKTDGLSEFVNCWARKPALDLSGIAAGGTLRFDGDYHGYINDFKTAGLVSIQDGGSAEVDLTLKGMLIPSDPKLISGHVSTRDLQAGVVAGIAQIGAVTADLDADFSFGDGGIRADLKSLDARSAEVLGYTFHDIEARGSWADDRLAAKFSSDDDNLAMSLSLSGSGKPGNGRMNYVLKGGITHADLHGMGLDERSEVSRISAGIDGRLSGDVEGTLAGNLKVGSVKLCGPAGEYDLGDIIVGIRESEGDNELRLSSSFADAHCTGTGGFSDFVRDIQTITTRRDLPALYTGKVSASKPGQYEFNLNLHDTSDLLEFALPQLFIADGTSLELIMGGNTGEELECSVRSEAIGWNGSFATDIEVAMDNADGSLGAFLTSSRIQAGKMNMTNAALNLYAQQNEYSAGLHYDGLSGTDNVGELYLSGRILRDDRGKLVIKARPLDSYIRFKNNLWEIGESDITFCEGDVLVDNFAIINGAQSLTVDGGIAAARSDTLSVEIDNFDLSLVDAILDTEYGISGTMTGRASVISPTSDAVGMVADLQCDSLAIGGHDAGSMHVAGDWDSATGIIEAFVSNDAGGSRALLAQASFNPDTHEVDATATMNDFDIGAAAPLLKNVFSDVSGTLSGQVTLDGTTDNMLLRSNDLRLDDAMLQVGFTGARYILDGPLALDNDGIRLSGMQIRDTGRGRGQLDGALRFGGSTPDLDGTLTFHDMLMIDSPAAAGNMIYGHLLASGNATVRGPLDGLELDADVTTQGEGQVHVSVSGNYGDQSSDLLTFTGRQPTAAERERELMLARLSAREEKAAKGNFTARARLTANPGVEAIVEIPGNGTRVNAFGSGTVRLDLQTAKDIFNLNGDYNVSGGSCHLDVGGVVAKDFTIQDGGSIKFGGDIMDSELDLGAVYTTKASLTDLIADTTSIATRRTVECGIHISERLRNPQLKFSLNIPDLEPATKALVDGALNTEDKVQKQVISVLLLGSFMAGETTGTGAATTTNSTLYSTVGKLMAGQISSILQKFDIPLDFGFNYQQNNTGTNVFDVGVSTQLFDNRVIVNGSVRNRQYTTAANAEMAGDLDIDFKLDNAGRIRASLFSHSADKYSSFLDNTQRNGGGISYQKEYNTLGEFFSDLFSSRRKREQRQVEEALRQKEQKIIKIDGKAVSDTLSAGR